MSPRSRSHRKKHGAKPFSGLRFVREGKVRIEWHAPGRGRQTRTIGPNTRETRQLADTILADALSEARREALAPDPGPPALTVAELVTSYLSDAATRPSRRTGQRLRPATLRLYRETVKQLRGTSRYSGMDLSRAAEGLSKAMVYDWMRRQREEGRAEGTIRRAVQFLKAVYRWAVEQREVLAVNPIAGVTVGKLPKSTARYEANQVRAMLTELLERPARAEWRFRVLIVACGYYGVRANQALHLRWADVDFDAGQVTWRQAAKGSKGQPDRTMPLLFPLREALVAAMNHRADETPWVTWNWRDPTRPAVLEGLYPSLRRLEARAGIDYVPGRGFHAFRRGVATLLADKHGIKQAADWIADTYQTTASHYTSRTAKSVKQAADTIGEEYGT